MLFYPIVTRSGCSKLRDMLHVFRFSPLKVVFVHPSMQPVPCPLAPAKASTIVVYEAGMSMAVLWCLSIPSPQSRAPRNCATCCTFSIFSLKGRFHSSVDAACVFPLAPDKASIHVVTKAGMSMGELWCLSIPLSQGRAAHNCAICCTFSGFLP